MIPPEHETIVLSDEMHTLEKEVRGQSIIFEGNQLAYGKIYTIRIRDAEVKVKLISKRFSTQHVTNKFQFIGN